MARQATRGTAIEQALRRELHRRGLRYRLHRKPVGGLRREADIVFPRARVAVFVDGCFWHACPNHVTWPKANAEFWRAKIERNRERDRDTDVRLDEAGWAAIRVWEHEHPAEAAVHIERIVKARLST
jgi:DNA mismatch endonuclease (patch repair protein)